MRVPVPYEVDRSAAEKIIREAAERHTAKIAELSEASLAELERRYFVRQTDLHPHVYYRLTDNWVEMTVRFVAEEQGVREIKDRMSREILEAFDQAGIGIASSTIVVTGMPELRVRTNEER
jgi:small-conductance mechanosensitive channel